MSHPIHSTKTKKLCIFPEVRRSPLRIDRDLLNKAFIFPGIQNNGSGEGEYEK
jgi:hypothetical protein